MEGTSQQPQNLPWSPLGFGVDVGNASATPNSKPQTPNPKLQTPNSSLSPLEFGVDVGDASATPDPKPFPVPSGPLAELSEPQITPKSQQAR